MPKISNVDEHKIQMCRWTYYDFYVRYRVLCRSQDVAKGNHRNTCENIVARLIQDPDKYQFGKNKLFFRAGQVAYMEKLRSDKLRACGVMIQKNVRMWLYRKKYQRVQAGTRLIQRWVRGFLARRRVRTLRREAAAVKLQSRVRGFLEVRKFTRLRRLAIGLQAQVRGWQARRQFTEMRREKAATLIQARVRGFVAKRAFDKDMRRLVICQNLVRKYFAQKKLKKLKIGAMNPTGMGTTLHSNSAPPFEYSTAPLCHCDWCMRHLGQNQGSLRINLSSASACLRTTYSRTIDRLWTMESLWNEVLYGYTKATICINTFGIISSMS